MNYDPNKYRQLGVGETVEEGDLVALDGGVGPVPAHSSVGHVVSQDDDTAFLRPLDQKPSTIESIADSLEIKTSMGRAALRVALSNVQLLDKKQQDYGSGNIAAFAEYGVLVRVWDKVSRLRNLLTNSKEPSNESVEDSWLDLSNYAIIAVLCRRGDWK